MRKGKKLNPLKGLIEELKLYRKAFKEGNLLTKVSFFIMGLAHICRGQIVKGFMYLILEFGFIAYMIQFGSANFVGLKTLGTRQQGMTLNEATGIFEIAKGHNSMLMLLAGITSVLIIVFFVIVWSSSVKSAFRTQQLKKLGQKLPGIGQDIISLFNSNIHKLLLFIPIIGLVLFTILPLIFMILMAFTNYDHLHQPPGKLFTWVGIDNFKALLLAKGLLSSTFWPILGWTLTWAFFATFSCYFFGMFIAILINMKGIRFKTGWRTVFVVAMSVPAFISLMVLRVALAQMGGINVLLTELGFITEYLPFLTDVTWARVSVVIVNMWIGIPSSMLLTTGILMNIPADLYESARIDGAGPVKAFLKITMPYMLFVTTPYLITNFIGNINNFNAIFFLTNGGPADLRYFGEAGKTDLLVTWLYRLTSIKNDYSYAAAIGIAIFIISGSLSLIVYRKSGAYKNEEGFQ